MKLNLKHLLRLTSLMEKRVYKYIADLEAKEARGVLSEAEHERLVKARAIMADPGFAEAKEAFNRVRDEK